MLEKMLQYQEIDKKAKNIKDLLQNSECKKKMQECKAFFGGVDEKVALLDNEACSIAIKVENLQKSFEENTGKIDEYSELIDTCEDNKELEYLMGKVSKLKSAINEIQTQITSLKKESVVIINKYKKLRETSDSLKAEYLSNKAEYEKLKESKKDEMKQIEDQLKEMEKDLDKKFLSDYKEVRAQYFPVLVKLNGNSCGYCGMELSQSALNSAGENLYIKCDECHRLLVK